MTLVEQGASPVRSRPRIDAAIGWVAAAIGATIAAQPLVVRFVYGPNKYVVLPRHYYSLQLGVGLLSAVTGSWLAARAKPHSVRTALCEAAWTVASVFAFVVVSTIAISAWRRHDLWARVFTSSQFLVPLLVAAAVGLAACALEQRMGTGRLDVRQGVERLVATGAFITCGMLLLQDMFRVVLDEGGRHDDAVIVRHALVVAIASGVLGVAALAIGRASWSRRLLTGAALVAAGVAGMGAYYAWEFHGPLSYRLRGSHHASEALLVIEVVAVVAVVVAVVCALQGGRFDEPVVAADVSEPESA